MNNRFKQIRLEKNLSQEEFGRKIGIESRAHISSLESGNRNITDRIVNDTCREFKVNEDWLRNGTGEMFKKIPVEDETAVYVSELLEDEDNPLYCLIKSIMKTYSQLDTESQNVLKKFSEDMLHNMNVEKED